MAEVLVVADDLTGGNATGALFARRGLTVVGVSCDWRDQEAWPSVDGADVLVVNTDTRRAPADCAAKTVESVVNAVSPGPRLLVKRVDTTLRGPVAAELDAALRARRRASDKPVCAIAAPAYPGAGRTTVGGIHLVDGIPLADSAAGRDLFTPVRVSRVASLLTCGTELRSGEVHVDVISAGVDAAADRLKRLWHETGSDGSASVFVLDAVTEAHLRTGAAAAAVLADTGVDVVAVDSGPFSAALADALRVGPRGGARAPVLVVAASPAERTAEQLEHLRADLDAVLLEVSADALDPQALADRLAEAVGQAATPGVRGPVRAVGWRLRRDDDLDPALAEHVVGSLAEAARRVFDRIAIHAVFASGGDMAAALLRALAAPGFAIDLAVQPLVVAGHLTGGPWGGLPFATKGGLIGSLDAISEAVVQLQSMPGRSTAHPRSQEALRWLRHFSH